MFFKEFLTNSFFHDKIGEGAKNMLKKILSLFLFLSIICSGCAKKQSVQENQDLLSVIKKRDKIIVGVKTDVPPFGFLDKDGKNIGFDVDLAKLLAKRLLGDENKVDFVPVNASNRIMKLSSKEVDMIIATMSITQQRQMILDFSVPYHIAGQAIMVRKDSKISSLMELQNKIAIIVFGSTVEHNLRSNVPNIRIIGFKTYPEAFDAFKKGYADAVISDDTILFGFKMKDNSVKILPKRYSKEPYAVAFRKDGNASELVNMVNLEITRLVDTGIIRQLKEKWAIN